MSQFHRSVLVRSASRLVLVGFASALLAGCSSDVSRFADFGSSPFGSSARVDQGSPFGGSQQMASAAPVSPVQAAPLSAPIQSAPLSAPMAAPVAAPVRAAATHPAPQPGSQPAQRAAATTATAPVRAPAQASPNIAAAKAVIAAQPAAQPAPAAPKQQAVTSVAKAEPPHPAPVVETPAKPVRTASLESQTSAKSDAAPTSTSVATEDASPEFRWPARGRIIQGFKSGKSEGISIAVPEGTAVKAAEGGTVAYAGSELKGYGNLVLIRHPNGFVSAYAHNGELLVKRGDTVKRGQVVAKSGQSGDVSSPQLQFQLRKGSTPVDPTQYLAGL